MQVDAVFTPNFGNNVSGKRLRRSASPSPLERPRKRMSTGLESNAATPSYAHHALPSVEDTAMNMNEDWLAADERGRSEDWVTKTSGLRLDSPSLSVFGQLLHTTAMSLPEGKEWNPRPFDDTISHPTHSSFLNNNLASAPPSSRGDLPTTVIDVDIDVHMNFGISSSKESFVNTPPSSGLWLSTALTAPLPQSPRKLRLKMGRRADCDKCKLNVKGHWMHFD